MAQPKNTATLFAAYSALASDEKTLVDLLSVAYTPLSQSDLDRALRSLKVKQPAKTLAVPLVQAGLVAVEPSYNSAKLYSCALPIVELVARQLAQDRRFDLLAQAVEAVAPLPTPYFQAQKYDFYSPDQLIRAVRIALYRRNFALIQDYYATIQQDRFGLVKARGLDEWRDPADVYRLICGNPFDREWLLQLPADIVDAVMPGLAAYAVNDWRHDEALFQLLQEGCAGRLGRDVPRLWQFFLGIWRLLRGEFEASAVPMGQAHEPGFAAWLTLLREGNDAGIAQFEAGLAELKKLTGKRKVFYPATLGAMHLLALWLRNRGGDARDAEAYLALWLKLSGGVPVGPCLENVPGLLNSHAPAAITFAGDLEHVASHWQAAPMDFVLAYLLAAWLQRDAAQLHIDTAQKCLEFASKAGFAWPAAELAALIAVVDPMRVACIAQAEVFEKSHGLTLLAHRFHYEEPWERALRSLANLGAAKAEPTESAAPTAEVRLAWLVHKQARYGSGLGYALELREQKRGTKGWAKGKAVTFKKLAEMAAAGESWLIEQDRQAARHIKQDRYTNGYVLAERGWLALAGHPHVQWADSGQPLELAAGRPELLVQKLKGEQVRIALEPAFADGQNIVLWPETPNRLKVAEILGEHRRIRMALGEEGIVVPLSARERVLEALGAVSSVVTVQSDIGGAVADGEAVAADALPRVHLLPEGAGLRIEILVRPFGESGPYYPPAVGGRAVFVEVDGKRLHTERDLKGEGKRAQALVDACPVLLDAESYQDYAWHLAEPDACLELLLQLQALEPPVRIEWPQGESFRLAGQAGLKQLSVNVRQSRDWFAVNGELRLDGGQVLDMQRLLELVGQSHSRFIQLDDGRFLALTDAFRKRLADLDALADSHGKERRIHALAAPLLEDWAEEAGEFAVDNAWRERIARMRDAEELQPVLPGNLQAELRDYQIEGYNWLARSAHWGVGACLADDMGLGKTLQALALMLGRAPGGPSLVIAPTSVCLNWHSEAVRFAPTLKVQVLGAGDRQKLVEALGPMDLLVCSYALLQQSSVAELLGGMTWRTIVLDEAQAIKNMATKRSQSAMSLQGDFKLITTGTPVENHLGELWNLFRFINPGLLGSLESFNRRFAAPIERGDKEARHRLKRLVQAFVLRRLKSDVLDELPSRTEITLTVELSEQERAFYEALRRKAVAELAGSSAGQGEKHLQVLAAIMKLRRACCHSSLATPGIAIPSSKLALFGETLEELLDNRHKALVFSQFVDHLGLLRAYLEEKGIAYQYLDGQTPAAERKKRVDAFQAGQGDVFLISLKAGGVGLNLTAADYVIHMDPWWNPAVEDQASDRAHRMGQQRPVTIYRLVAKDTIEEKIVALHRHKRDLADSVLAGTEAGGKIGTEELLSLIREE